MWRFTPPLARIERDKTLEAYDAVGETADDFVRQRHPRLWGAILLRRAARAGALSATPGTPPPNEGTAAPQQRQETQTSTPSEPLR